MRFISYYLISLFLFLITLPIVYGEEIGLPVSPSDNFVVTVYPGQGKHSDLANLYAYDLVGNGDPVAIADGKVRCVGFACDSSGKGGICVIINHPNLGGRNLDSLYCHLAVSRATTGADVSKGQPVGIIGSTGASEGVHLHFSLVEPGTLKSYNSAGLIDFSKIAPASGGSDIISPNPVDLKDLNLGEIGQLVCDFYTNGLALGGTLALLIIVFGGVKYILSFGNPSQQTDAKEWIKAAVFGLALLLVAYIILKTINPCLVGPGTGCG